MSLAAFVALSFCALGLSEATVASAQAYGSSSPSEVQTEPAEVTPTGVKLRGKLNPNGASTTYYFKYAQNTCDEGCTPTTTAVAGPLTGDTQQEVSAVEVTGLAAGHYWAQLVASNTEGTTYGTPVNFTVAATDGPSIESESVSHVTSTDATLEAQINPNGRYTGYEFQIDTNSNYNFTQPNCPFELPGYAQCESIRVGEPLPAGLVEPEPAYIAAGSGSQSVSVNLASIGATLQPSMTYHYRVLASSGGSPTVVGPDQTFTMPEDTVQPLSTRTPPPSGAGQTAGPSSVDQAAGLGVSSFSSTLGVKSSGKTTPTLKSLTNAQRLAKALKACEKKPKGKRAACEKQLHRKYPTTASRAKKR